MNRTIRIATKDGRHTHVFHVQVAVSEEDKIRGLMNRDVPLAPDEGFLFCFDPPQLVDFWMKDTLIPLELAYFDKNKRLVQIETMPVEGNPNQPRARYPSNLAIQYALEVAPGALAEIDPHSREWFLCLDEALLQAL